MKLLFGQTRLVRPMDGNHLDRRTRTCIEKERKIHDVGLKFHRIRI